MFMILEKVALILSNDLQFHAGAERSTTDYFHHVVVAFHLIQYGFTLRPFRYKFCSAFDGLQG